MTLHDKFNLALIQTQLRREEGQTMAEYGILVAVIALVAILGATIFGTSLKGFFTGLGNNL